MVQIPQLVKSIQKGAWWLKEHAESLIDSRDIAITILALLAAEKNPHSNLVQRLTAALIRRQSPNGSWSDELWDTTWASKALNCIGYQAGDSNLQAALSFLEATQDSLSGNWYEEPFETMLVLDLIATIAPERTAEFSERSLKWISSLQNSAGCIVGIRYTGMAVSLFRLMKSIGCIADNKIADLGTCYIRRDLESKPIWTGAAWSNHYPLKALLDSGAALDDPVVARAVTWFVASQDGDGRWMQVSKIHDTAMAVIVLSSLLTTPLVDISVPRIAVLNASRENGTMRVSFHGPEGGAITPAERMKISTQVRAELSHNQQLVVAGLGLVRDKTITRVPAFIAQGNSILGELEKAGRYAYGHLVPARIQLLMGASPADHLRLEIDERLIDLPWELIHDGSEYLCMRYAMGRLLMSDQGFQTPHRHPQAAKQTRVLVVANPTGDLPAAAREGREVTKLLRDKCGMHVDEYTASNLGKKDFLLALKEYAIIHFAGHASYNSSNPDESCLHFADGEIQAFEISRFVAGRAPSVVFLNACWSAEELRNVDSFSPMMRGLGRTFLYAGVTTFLGYLVPVPDDSATRFAISFYDALVQGQTVGEASRRARILCRDSKVPNDLTWSAAVLYGDPSIRVVEAASNG